MRRLLTIETGLACNNHCEFCPQRVIRGTGGGWVELETDELKSRLNDARRQGFDQVAFSGGEPSIRKDLVELVGHARSIGFEKVSITTNGRMFAYRDLADRVVRAGLTGVSVSIHGPNAAIHDALTGTPGSFRQALRGLANLRAASVRISRGLEISTVTLVVPANIAHLRQVLELGGSLGAGLHIVQPFILSRENLDRAGEFLLPEKAIVDAIEDALEGGLPHGGRVKPYNIPPCLLDHLGDVIEKQTYSLDTFREFESGVGSREGRRPGGQFYRTSECDDCRRHCPGFRIEHLPEEDAAGMILDAVGATIRSSSRSSSCGEITLGSLDLLTGVGLRKVLSGARRMGVGRVRVIWGGYGRTDTRGLLQACRENDVDEVCLLACPEMVRPGDRKAMMPGNLDRISSDLALFEPGRAPVPSLLVAINMLFDRVFAIDMEEYMALVSRVGDAGGRDAFITAPEVISNQLPRHDQHFVDRVVTAAPELAASVHGSGLSARLVRVVEQGEFLASNWLETRLQSVLEVVDWSNSYVRHPFAGPEYGWVMWSSPGWLFNHPDP
ncbi:MAG: radical SAM protein [Deltaproteobacteria bacterium]|nr:radical SAM protein [Deltaproteobacteria bacterium]